MVAAVHYAPAGGHSGLHQLGGGWSRQRPTACPAACGMGRYRRHINGNLDSAYRVLVALSLEPPQTRPVVRPVHDLELYTGTSLIQQGRMREYSGRDSRRCTRRTTTLVRHSQSRTHVCPCSDDYARPAMAPVRETEHSPVINTSGLGSHDASPREGSFAYQFCGCSTAIVGAMGSIDIRAKTRMATLRLPFNSIDGGSCLSTLRHPCQR